MGVVTGVATWVCRCGYMGVVIGVAIMGVAIGLQTTLGTLLIASLNFSEFSDNHNFR